MIYNIDKIYELIQAGLFTEENKKEYKKYVLKKTFDKLKGKQK